MRLSDSTETYKEMVERFNNDPGLFIESEVLRLFYESDNPEFKFNMLHVLASCIRLSSSSSSRKR